MPKLAIDPSVLKWSKWTVFLLLARTPRPLAWSSALSLNPLIRKLLSRAYKNVYGTYGQLLADVQRRIAKLSNFITSTILFVATADNVKIPKDYLLIYLWIGYYGVLNPPSALNILVSPNLSPFLKISHYRSETLSRLYENKEFIIFPLIFAQILSNYLTPTKYKLNQRYLSTSIKQYFLNPIWINYSLGVNSHSINWLGLFKSYLKHNAYLCGFFALANFKSRFLDAYYEIKHGLNDDSIWNLVKNYFSYVFHKGNGMVNFIYSPNLISIFLISLTSPLFSYLKTSPKNSILNKTYSSHLKFFFKTYTKVIGAVAGFITLYANSMDLVPDFWYKKKPVDYDDYNNSIYLQLSSNNNVRRISKTFLDGLNLYLFRLILLSKWRIIKENHPWFKLLKLKTWNRIEALVMCYGVWKLMNLNDFVRNNKFNLSSHEECERLEKETLVKLVNRIM